MDRSTKSSVRIFRLSVRDWRARDLRFNNNFKKRKIETWVVLRGLLLISNNYLSAVDMTTTNDIL